VNASPPLAQLLAAVTSNSASAVRDVLERHPEVKARLNEPLPGLPFDSTPLLAAVGRRNRDMIRVLLDAGADINARSGWWAGGFGVLDSADHAFVPFLVEQGATIDAHAAAQHGMLDRLQQLIAADSAAVHARGGDGQMPLHVAATVEIARYLLDRGADIDARDVDHESTPAQYMLRDRPEVARYLVERGCRTDILMAATLGNLELVRSLLDADPGSIRKTVSDEDFPKQDPRSGGTIYNWVLGSHWTPHKAAHAFGHQAVLRELMDRSPQDLKLAVACELGDEATVRTLTAARPDLASTLSDRERRKLVSAAGNNDTVAVRLMLQAGWPVDVRGQHGGTALHWAAWHGNTEMTREILRHGPQIDLKDHDHHSTPLGWAVYGSRHGWHPDRGDYAGTVSALLDAGATPPDVTADLDASDAVQDVLRQRLG
jgi:ankyrin repeat protein